MPPSEANYDETKVPLYSLPDPLTLASGESVADAATWTKVRRPEILQLFKTHVFGEIPGPLPGILVSSPPKRARHFQAVL